MNNRHPKFHPYYLLQANLATNLRRDKKNKIIAHALSFPSYNVGTQNTLMLSIVIAGAAWHQLPNVEMLNQGGQSAN
ncbi:MAG: hypothetical protein D3924_19410 [Candidatus Electrothrix sp. AR4]|nr:hypothetical protein [Candidatus Electrothrix sp. AR4]